MDDLEKHRETVRRHLALMAKNAVNNMYNLYLALESEYGPEEAWVKLMDMTKKEIVWDEDEQESEIDKEIRDSGMPKLANGGVIRGIMQIPKQEFSEVVHQLMETSGVKVVVEDGEHFMYSKPGDGWIKLQPYEEPDDIKNLLNEL